MKQNEIASKYAIQEIEKEKKWYSQEVENMLRLFSAQEKLGKGYKVLKSISEYPISILSGWTWNRVFGGLLLKEDIRSQIICFYEQNYSSYQKMLIDSSDNVASPIWVVIRSNELENNTVYPLIVNLKDFGKHIVLAINEI